MVAPFSHRSAALAVTAVSVALATAGCSSVGSSLKQVGAGVHSSPNSTYKVTAPVTTVNVDTAGSITVTAGTGSGSGPGPGPVTVTENASYSATPPVTSHAVASGVLTLADTCKAQLICNVDYTITVPRGTAVHAVSRGSSVTLGNLSGPVTAQTFAGLLSATGLASPTATLKSTVGGIDATFAAAPASLSASTTAGSITLEVPGSAAYQVNADAVVGVSTVTVRRAAAPPHAITAHSDLGSITISPS